MFVPDLFREEGEERRRGGGCKQNVWKNRRGTAAARNPKIMRHSASLRQRSDADVCRVSFTRRRHHLCAPSVFPSWRDLSDEEKSETLILGETKIAPNVTPAPPSLPSSCLSLRVKSKLISINVSRVLNKLTGPREAEWVWAGLVDSSGQRVWGRQ